MALYPTNTEVPFDNGYGITSRQKILSSNFDDQGVTQKKKKWLYPKRDINISYNNINDIQLTELIQFEVDRDGTFSMFTWIEENEYQKNDEYFATGDGSTVLFNLPCKAASTVSVYGDSSPYDEAEDSTSVGDFYITESGGTDGLDSITFFVAPAEGVRLTIDFLGRLGVRCRFKEAIVYNRTRYGTLGLNNCNVSLEGFHMDE